MLITKKLAIEAIKSEPNLTPNFWFGDDYVMYQDMSHHEKQTCNVCAVGAVLRKNCFTTKYKSSSIIHDWCDAGYLGANLHYTTHFIPLNPTNYLGNLSMLFETLCDTFLDPNSDTMRSELINYIEAYWPKEFELN